MKEHFVYEPKGVCASEIAFDIEDGIVSNIRFKGGCAGNASGVARLCERKSVSYITKRLKGVVCRGNTSCPDQFTRAIEAYMEGKNG